MGDEVAEGAAHGEAWSVLLHEPHPHRTKVLAEATFDGVNSAADGEDSLLFDGHAWLMILRQRRNLNTTLRPIIRIQNTPRIANICREDRVPVEENGHAGGAAQLGVKINFGQILMNLRKRTMHLPWDPVVEFCEARVGLVEFVLG